MSVSATRGAREPLTYTLSVTPTPTKPAPRDRPVRDRPMMDGLRDGIGLARRPPPSGGGLAHQLVRYLKLRSKSSMSLLALLLGLGAGAGAAAGAEGEAAAGAPALPLATLAPPAL